MLNDEEIIEMNQDNDRDSVGCGSIVLFFMVFIGVYYATSLFS